MKGGPAEYSLTSASEYLKDLGIYSTTRFVDEQESKKEYDRLTEMYNLLSTADSSLISFPKPKLQILKASEKCKADMQKLFSESILFLDEAEKGKLDRKSSVTDLFKVALVSCDGVTEVMEDFNGDRIAIGAFFDAALYSDKPENYVSELLLQDNECKSALLHRLKSRLL